LLLVIIIVKNEEDIRNIKFFLIKAIEGKMKGRIGMNLYRIYLALMYPGTNFTEMSLREELKNLEKMRKREKERLR